MTKFDTTMPSALSRNVGAIVKRFPVNDMARLRGLVADRFLPAFNGANRLWKHLRQRDFVPALVARSGDQATKLVRARLRVNGHTTTIHARPIT